MNKQKYLKPVNSILAISFLALILSALLHDSIPYNIYRNIHPLFGYILTTMVFVHVYLNFNWIKKNILSK
ncbi:MAG: hypothetical protein JXQ26_07350 [Tissierellales bacterium]|nr:hypothetical protein [Tissierellales bacterium]MBN2827789.1 hypothetical protein [Tissierellales bacterium]